MPPIQGTRKVIRDMMQEARLVGEALGVKFSVDVDERIAMAEKVGAHRTSMLQDVEAGQAHGTRCASGRCHRIGTDGWNCYTQPEFGI